jgi:carbon-monoxide dehydrogenase large subunit
VAGQGRYAADVRIEGEDCVVFVRSNHAPCAHSIHRHARLQAMPGVLAVITGADLVQAGVKPIGVEGSSDPTAAPWPPPPRRALAHERVRYVGEPVVAVVADRVRQPAPRRGDLHRLRRVAGSHRSPRRDAFRCAGALPEAPDNISAFMAHGNAAKTEARVPGRGLTSSRSRSTNQRVAPSPMEPRCTVAYLEGGRLTMRLSSQMPTGVRTDLCGSLGLDPKDVRVLVGDVGGGFGMKTGIYPEDIVVGHAARTLRRPVRWQAERIEEFLSAVHGRDVLSRAELALDAQGKVLGLRVRSTANLGAYATGAASPSR